MAELVNLRQFRKKKTREKHEEEAQQNRILFGRTKVEKEFEERLKAKNIQQIKLGKLSDTEE